MASVVLKTLSVLLGLFFIFVGIMKLTPRLSRDMHKDLRKSFVRYAKVFPLAQALEFKVSAKWFRRIVGSLEILCGFSLVFVPGFLKELANFILLVMMIGAVYTHHAIGDKFERTAPAIVFTFMLTCRLVVYLQVRRKCLRDARAAAAKSVQPQISPSGLNSGVAVPPPAPATANSKQLKQD